MKTDMRSVVGTTPDYFANFPSIYGEGTMVLDIRRRKGYVIRKEVVDMWGYSSDLLKYKPGMVMDVAYTENGKYVGDPKSARFFFEKKGLTQLDVSKTGKTCNIGFSEKEKKWYGWSHRAICGFGIGDKLFIENFGDDETPFVKHGKVTITTLAQAKVAARRFAASVS